MRRDKLQKYLAARLWYDKAEAIMRRAEAKMDRLAPRLGDNRAYDACRRMSAFAVAIEGKADMTGC